MDEDYTDNIDTSVDMDVLDVDMSEDYPEDIPEEGNFEQDVLDVFTEDIHGEDNDDNIVYDEESEYIEDDISRLGLSDTEIEEIDGSAEEFEENTEEVDGSAENFPEDTFEDVDGDSDSEERINDFAEDTAIFETDSNKEAMNIEDIPEDADISELTDQNTVFEEDIPEDTEPIEEMETMADTYTREAEIDGEAETDKETMGADDSESIEPMEIVADLKDMVNAANEENEEAMDLQEEQVVDEIAEAETENEAAEPVELQEETVNQESAEGTTDLEETESVEQQEGTVNQEFEEDTMDVEKPEDGPSDNVRHTASGMETDNPSDVSGFKRLLDYMSSHNYGREDFAAYSQDPQWRLLMREEYPDYELPELSKESADAQLLKYMSDHNYGMEDYTKYSQDPIWRELHEAAFPDDTDPQPVNLEAYDLQKEYDNSYEAQELRDLGIKNVDLRECLPEYRKDIVSAVKDMLNDNPELKQQLSDVICCTIDDNRYADYEPTESDKPFVGKLRLNSEFFTSNTLRADLAEESKVGWSVPNDSPQSIVSHELGHGIHLGLCAKSCGISPGTIPKTSRYQEAVRQYMTDVHADTIVETACRDLGVEFNTDDFANHLSRYGSGEYGEALAEAVAEVKNNLNPRPMARTIYSRLMQYKKSMNGGKVV